MSPAILLRTGAIDDITIDRREALRYLGYRGDCPPEIDELLQKAHDELCLAASLKACYTRLPLSVDGDTLDFGVFRLQSKSLMKNLAGCKEVYLFAATLGAGVDRLLLRESKLSPAFAMVLDAYCSAAVEGWCNALQASFGDNGEQTRPRFSPGYGDVPLSFQKDVLRVLDAGRKIGVTLSDSYFMTPAKSVTAFAGIESDPA